MSIQKLTTSLIATGLLFSGSVYAQTPAELFRQEQQRKERKLNQANSLNERCFQALSNANDAVYGTWYQTKEKKHIVLTYNSRTNQFDSKNWDKKAVFEFNPGSKKCRRIGTIGEVVVTSSVECKTYVKTVQTTPGNYQVLNLYSNPRKIKEQWVQENQDKILALYKSVIVSSCSDYIRRTHQPDVNILNFLGEVSIDPGVKTKKSTWQRQKVVTSHIHTHNKWRYLDTIKGLKYFYSTLPSNEKGILKFQFTDGNDNRYSDIDIKCGAQEFRRIKTDNKWLKISKNKGDIINKVYTKYC